MTGEAWSRFLDYAARARTKPAFDVEDRDWKLEVAAELRSAIAGGEGWSPRLLDVLHRPRLPFLMAERQRKWLRDWSDRDIASLRVAVASLTDTALDPVERLERFAAEVERAHGRGAGQDASTIVTIGSVLNFAMDPAALPIVRPGVVGRLAEIVGEPLESRDGSAADLYAAALAFTRRVAERLETAGIPVRDMVDVQSLIDVSVTEARMWTTDPPPGWLERAHRALPAGAAYLAACALFRNEARYLSEWIEFHRLVGVSRFFLFNNASDDDYLDVLEPYLDEEIVVLHEWPAPGPDQRDVFDECLRMHRHDARWIAFIDLDEFLFSPAGEALDQVLPAYERWPGVGVEWAMFSLSGRRDHPGDLVIDSYPFRDAYDQRLIKSVVDPQRTVRCDGAHWFEFEYGLPADENGWPLAFPASKTTSFARLRINHYASRSEEEAREKIARQSGWTHMRRWRERDLRGELDLVYDDAISRWVPPLRASLAKGVLG